VSPSGDAPNEPEGGRNPPSSLSSRAFDENLDRLGRFIRSQRKLADLTLRELSSRANVSNPYLSAIERGLHEPSVRVLKAIAAALNLSAETLLAEAGVIADAGGDAAPASGTEAAIRADDRLTDDQKRALLSVYRSYVSESESPG
jgi:transcriptional regulator with XRE-family HTH domain